MKVVFICGASRSGSTLLDRMLGALPGIVSTGELRRIWDRGFVLNEVCGCGEPFKECGFWRAVIEEACGGFDKIDPLAVRRLRASLGSRRKIARLGLATLTNSAHKDRLAEYSQCLVPIYRAICAVAGASVIVDSSKTAAHGLALMATGTLDVRGIHLVRDSRAVAFSQQRRKSRAVNGQSGLMRTMDPRKSAKKWISLNARAHMIRMAYPRRYTRVRYEDLVVDPSSTLLSLLKYIDEEPSPLDAILRDSRVRLGCDHTVSGNPMRFTDGWIDICPDDEWRLSMSASDMRLVRRLTWPLLLAYGYPLRRVAQNPLSAPGRWT